MATVLTGNKAKSNVNSRTGNSCTAESLKRSCNSDSNGGARYESAYSQSTFDLAENRNRNNNGPKKPPFTYTELIEHALQERGELTVSAIYQWIS